MKTKNLYSLQAVQSHIEKYISIGGEVIEAVHGSLGYGTTICKANGKKSTVIQEVFVNSWSSSHTITLYNKLPKKYEKLLEQWYDTAE